MVELRKRKAPAPAPAPPAKKKNSGKGAASKAAKAKTAVSEKVEAVKEAITGTGGANGTAKATTDAPAVDDIVDLATFGGEIETNDGKKTTLQKLVEESKAGVVLFTYPRASTPGCTTQVCLFRDSYTALTTTGLSIYGLSTDSPKANTTFKTKQNLPYPLLCDPSSTLIKAIGMTKSPKGTKRGVFVIDKTGKVVAAEGGGPQATVDVVRRIVEQKGDPGSVEKVPSKEEVEAKDKDDREKADVADEVADTAAKIDEEPAKA